MKDTVNDIVTILSNFQTDFETRVRRCEIHVHNLRKATEPIRFAQWWRDCILQQGIQQNESCDSDRDNDVEIGADSVVHGCANRNE